MPWDIDHPFQALALTGGGYRGLFTAKVLAVLEEAAGRPIAQCFDLLSGTSIGGIVALAAAFEVPMAKVVDVFVNDGEKIFPQQEKPTSIAGNLYDAYKFRNQPRYNNKPLRDAIIQLIPEQTVLGDALHPTAIPTVNLTEGRPQVFKTRHFADWDRDQRFKVVDIALATSAAPTFFPLVEIANCLHADGGLFANAPDLIAVHEAEHFLQTPISCIRLLSIGTTSQKYSLSHSGKGQLGILDWMQNARLFNATISSQQQFVHQIIKHRLDANYLRIDQLPSHEQANDLGLDIASRAAQKTLLGLAEKAATDILKKELAPFLGNTPQLKIIRQG